MTRQFPRGIGSLVCMQDEIMVVASPQPQLLISCINACADSCGPAKVQGRAGHILQHARRD